MILGKPSLNLVLFITFSIMSLIPVLLLGWWVVDSARSTEYKRVEEKHLLVAKNVTLALSRYAQDTTSILEYFSSIPLEKDNSRNNKLLHSKNITSIRIFDENGLQLIGIDTENGLEPKPLTMAQLKVVKETLGLDNTVFLPIQIGSNGKPKILIITPMMLERNYLVAELASGYFLQLQAKVEFGKFGHAAIVDQVGNVIAHPKSEWVSQIKNISTFSAVKRLMNREIGVDEFYSTAKKTDMISGFSFVKETGWGVIVPQPLSELEDQITYFKRATIGVALVGIILALLISWFLSKRMARPTQELAKLANYFKMNQMQYQLEPVKAYTREQHELSQSFHDMLYSLRNKNNELLHRSNYDLLTGLPNRNFLTKYLNENIHNQESFIFSLVDLNDFKDINDHWSHSHGDELLKLVANRLDEVIFKNGLVSRIGGDEFAIVFNSNITKEKAESLIVSLRKRLQESYLVLQERLSIDCSSGLSCYPQDATNRSDLMQCADLAVYAAKEAEKLNYQWYKPYMRAELNERVELTQDLRDAIKKNEFIIHLQPKVDVESYMIQGFEALVRWQHPKKGLVSPCQFIPLAENTGQILPLGELIIDSVCKKISLLHQKKNTIVPVAINLSVRQFDDPELAIKIENIINRYNLLPENIEFEITESLLAKNSMQVETLLNKIINFGCEISLDDFGTDQSSLSRLKNFDFHKIKIDKSFIDELNSNEKVKRILESIINIGKTLKLSVIIEGVETQKQLSTIQAMGCNQIQGFVFSPGVDFESAIRLLKDKKIAPKDWVNQDLNVTQVVSS